MLLIGFQLVCMILLNAPIAYIIFDFVQLNLKSDWVIATELPYFLYGVMAYTITFTLFFLSIVAFLLHYYSSIEIVEARSLKEEIRELGKQKRSYGIKKEI